MPHSPALAYIGYGKQSVAGTAVAPTRFSRWTAVRDAQEQMRLGYYRDGSTRDIALAIKLATWHDAAFTTWLFPDTGTALLDYFLGGTDVVTGAADPYQHSFSELSGDLTSLPLITVEHSMGNGLEIDRIKDGIIDQLVLKAVAGNLTTLDVAYKGTGAVAQASASTVTFETDRPAIYADGTLTLTGMDVAPCDVTQVSIDMKNTGEQVYTFCGIAPAVIFPTAREFAVEFTVFVPDNKLYREIFFGSATGTAPVSAPSFLSTLTLKFDLGGTPDHFVQLSLNNIAMTDAKPTYDANAKAFMLACKGTAVKGTSSICTITSQNAVSAAYV